MTIVAPELIVELQGLLIQRAEYALVDQVAELKLVDRGRCGDCFCGSFYTARKPNIPLGSGHCTIPLWSEIGIVNIDVMGSTIVYVEVLYRDDLRDKTVAAVV